VVLNCTKRLRPNGKLFFSNNLRSFKLDQRILELMSVEDMSKATIPPDFHNQLIHKAWLLSSIPPIQSG